MSNKETANTEFEYNEDDSGNGLYRQVMTGEAYNVSSPEDVTETVNVAPAPVASKPKSKPTPKATSVPQVGQDASQFFFLVEGRIRLDQFGEPPVYSDQRRIVRSTDLDSALEKFVEYFRSMSNENQQYTVVQAGGSETIL